MNRKNMHLAAALFGATALSALVGLSGTWAAPAATAQARVDAAYAAMGGDKLAALKTISLKAHLAQYDPGEILTPSTIPTSRASIRLN